MPTPTVPDPSVAYGAIVMFPVVLTVIADTDISLAISVMLLVVVPLPVPILLPALLSVAKA